MASARGGDGAPFAPHGGHGVVLGVGCLLRLAGLAPPVVEGGTRGFSPTISASWTGESGEGYFLATIAAR
jgi:hypothetical protein